MGPIKLKPAMLRGDNEGGGQKPPPTPHPKVRKASQVVARRKVLHVVRFQDGFRINGTTYEERKVHQQLLGPDARASGERPRFVREGKFWFATVQNFVDWITPEGENVAYTPEQITEELILDLITSSRKDFADAKLSGGRPCIRTRFCTFVIYIHKQIFAQHALLAVLWLSICDSDHRWWEPLPNIWSKK